jgi:hypothetical protein
MMSGPVVPETVRFRASEKLMADARAVCAKEGISLSELARQALRHEVRRIAA